MTARDPRSRRGRGIATCFALSALASLGLAVVYLLGGQAQVEGVLLGVALGGIGVGLVLWAKEMMPGGPYVEEREQTLGEQEARSAAAQAFETGAERVERRGFLARMLGAALGALGLAALFPIRSLGTDVARDLLGTPWRRGSRLVTLGGAPIRPTELGIGTVLTVFPEGHVGRADAQTLLIRLAPGEYEPLEGREDWAPMDFVGFSKICPHAGCPVGLYRPTDHVLLCPCHQSVFAVLQGAEPIAGPATRPLPQLPLMIDPDGYLAAAGDYTEPVGPGFWTRPDA